MKTLPAIFITAFCFLFASGLHAQAQAGGPMLNAAVLSDSLTVSSEKTSDGFYYKSIPLFYNAGSRLYIHYSAYGPNYQHISLVFMDAAGQVKRYNSGTLLGTSLSGTIDIDTALSTAGSTSILLTTSEPGDDLKYTCSIYYASAEAMNIPADADICWRIAYAMKQSDVNYRFMRQSKKGGGFYTSYNTNCPLRSDSPDASTISEGISSIYYESTIGRGTEHDADVFYEQMRDYMKQCLGTIFTYSESKDENGKMKLVCSAMSETKGQDIRNLSYMNKKDEKLEKYVITIYLKKQTVSGSEMYDVVLKLENKFAQF